MTNGIYNKADIDEMEIEEYDFIFDVNISKNISNTTPGGL